jgi:very-short-patch-repair endonuclease
MSLDYVICTRDFTVLVAIELDDATHNQSNRIKADSKKERALTSAGIRLIRWKVNQIPVGREIREALKLKCMK